jgi:predicted dehydrogenase
MPAITALSSLFPKLRAAVIGTSRVGSAWDDYLADTPELIPSSHAGCYTAHPRTELVAGCDLNPEKLAAFGERWGIAPEHRYTDFREMIGKERPDVVSVTTSWSRTKDEIVPVVATSGVRGIFCEKPLCTSMAVADEIVRLVEANGIAFQCGYPRRFNPRYQAVRGLIEQGEIGEVVSVTIVGAASLLHDATHDWDAMAYFAGGPEPALAFGALEAPRLNRHGQPVQDLKGDGYVQHTNGVRFLMEGAAFPGSSTRVIAGTEARIIAVNDCKEVELWRHPAERTTRWMSLEPQSAPATVKSPQMLGLEDLVAAIDGGRQPVYSVRRAARFMEYSLALHSSHRRGGRVSFPIEDREVSVDTF